MKWGYSGQQKIIMEAGRSATKDRQLRCVATSLPLKTVSCGENSDTCAAF